MPVETPAFVGPQFPNLTDRLMGVGHRSTDSGYRTSQLILPVEQNRLYLRIQNENNAPLFVKFGGTVPTATDYDICLKAATAANDGSGGFYECWNNTEAIAIFSATTYKVAVLEIEI